MEIRETNTSPQKRILFGFATIVLFIVLLLPGSCKKESKLQPQVAAVPECNPPGAIRYFTERPWTSDTIIVTPPMTYSQLSDDDKLGYKGAMSWFRYHGLIFFKNGSFNKGTGDWDSGLYEWCLINNQKDIKILYTTGSRDTLRNWSADSLRFTYQRNFKNYSLTYIFK